MRHFFRLSPLGLDHRVMRCTLCGLGLTSAQAALPSWVDFMKEVLVGRPSQEFLPPPGVVQATVDPTSGGIATAGCPTRVTELFIEGTEPRGLCPLHGMGK